MSVCRHELGGSTPSPDNSNPFLYFVFGCSAFQCTLNPLTVSYHNILYANDQSSVGYFAWTMSLALYKSFTHVLTYLNVQTAGMSLVLKEVQHGLFSLSLTRHSAMQPRYFNLPSSVKYEGENRQTLSPVEKSISEHLHCHTRLGSEMK